MHHILGNGDGINNGFDTNNKKKNNIESQTNAPWSSTKVLEFIELILEFGISLFVTYYTSS